LKIIWVIRVVEVTTYALTQSHSRNKTVTFEDVKDSS